MCACGSCVVTACSEPLYQLLDECMHYKPFDMLLDANVHSRVDHDIALLCGLVDPLLVVDMHCNPVDPLLDVDTCCEPVDSV